MIIYLVECCNGNDLCGPILVKGEMADGRWQMGFGTSAGLQMQSPSVSNPGTWPSLVALGHELLRWSVALACPTGPSKCTLNRFDVERNANQTLAASLGLCSINSDQLLRIDG
jgi:hypothetical protein